MEKNRKSVKEAFFINLLYVQYNALQILVALLNTDFCQKSASGQLSPNLVLSLDHHLSTGVSFLQRIHVSIGY
jgi:hypothetical protein